MCGSTVHFPARVGEEIVEENVDRLPVTAPLRQAIDSTSDCRSRLLDLCSDKAAHKEIASNLKRHQATRKLSPSLLFCLHQGTSAGGKGDRHTSGDEGIAQLLEPASPYASTPFFADQLR